MGLNLAVRPQGPVAAAVVPPERDLTLRTPTAPSVRPVTETQRPDAVQQAAATVAAVAARLSGQDGSDHPAAEARAAAEAARMAYIKASLAAGISPLPLP